ncbi:MAG: penicillin acylase family protein [Thermoanaerobaculia bacterium]
MRRVVRRALAGLLALALLLGLALLVLVRRNLPGRDGGRIASLDAAATADLDDRGVATVRAATVEDALRVQGFLTARERAFQLEILRRTAAGRLAELFGASALPLDRKHRLYGFARVAEAAVPLLPARERADLEAYAEGVNAGFASRRGRLGLEFALLRTEPGTWRPADSVSVLLLMYEQLTDDTGADTGMEELARLPEPIRAFLAPRATADDVLLVPDAIPPGPPPLPVLDAGALRALPQAARLAAPEEEGVAGSNAFAISGSLTRSGKPILAGDPHLGLEMPGIWLPMRFAVAGRTAEGVTLPGLPALTIGRTDLVAWSFTNLEADVQDLFRERIENGRARRGEGFEKVAERTETIRVRGGKEETLVVRSTSNGPLLEGDLALRWTALDPANLCVPNGDFLRAADEAAFLATFDAFTGPPQNVVWASASGAIGWRPAGLLPRRREGTDGSVPYDAADPANGWRGFVPMSDLPRVVDPPEGFVVTANQRTIGTSFGTVVSADWGHPGRARRIRDLLRGRKAAGTPMTRADAEAIQLDERSETMRRTAAALRPFLPADLARLLDGWDGTADASSARYLVARALRRAVREKALAAWKAPAVRWHLEGDNWNDLLEAGDAAFRAAGLGPRDAFLAGAAADAVSALEERWGKERARWTWGEANRLAARHPLGRVPGLSWLFDPPRPQQPGAPGTPRAASPSFGQSLRWIVDWGAPEEATLVVPFGVSGHVGSPNRLDQLPYWREGDPGGRATRLSRPPSGEPIRFSP